MQHHVLYDSQYLLKGGFAACKFFSIVCVPGEARKDRKLTWTGFVV